MQYPRGLVRYSTEHAMSGKPTRILRPRLIIYSLLLALFATLFVTSLATRPPLIVDVIRDRNALYRDVGREGIENTYTVHAINKDQVAHSYTLSVAGIEGMRIVTDTTVSIDAESSLRIPVAVRVPHAFANGGQRIEFTLAASDGSGTTVSEDSRFRGPTTRY